MTPTLALDTYKTILGPAPTLLGIVIGLCWMWCIWKKYPLNKPLLRLAAVLEMCVVLSMALGFNDTFAERFRDGGGYGGWLGNLVAGRILGLDIPMLTGIVITLLVVSAIASVIVATEWFGIPLFFRLQQMDPAFANTGYVGTQPPSRAAEPMQRAAVEDDSTADPLVSFGASSETATATLERDETAPSTYTPPQGVLGRRTHHDDEVLPPSGAGETIAPDEEDDPAGTPWYARRRARREAERAEREAREAPEDEARSDEAPSPREARRSRYSRDFEREPIFDEPSPSSPPREFDSTESQAATSDLEDRLAESVDFAAPAAEPIADPAIERPRAEYVAPSEIEPTVESPVASDAGVVPPPQKTGAEPDSFDDFFGSVSESLAAPPVAEPEAAREAAVSRDGEFAAPPVERAVEPVVESAPEPVVDSIAPTSPAEESPVESEAPAAEPARSIASDDPEQQLFVAAGDAVVSGQRASISFLQRSLSIGYFQAAKLLDRLEREGVIGPYTGAVSRNVLMDPATWSRHKNN